MRELTKGVTYDGAKMLQRYQETTIESSIRKEDHRKRMKKADCNGKRPSKRCCYRKQVSNKNKE